MTHGALVPEGGSLRGLFTSGVVDVMMERGLIFDYVNGVSAGALNAINYVSGQVGRSRDASVSFIRDRRYIGLNNLLFHGGIFNFDFLFGILAEELLPFDQKAFDLSPQTLECVATSCETGRAEFFRRGACADYMMASRASASMPLLAKEVLLNGKPYLDGGIALPIAYGRALDCGYDKAVVVLTREQGYRKPPEEKLYAKMLDVRYADNVDLLHTLHRIPEHYNEMQVEMDELVRQGKLFLIRPSAPITMGKVERDPNELEALYQRGRADCEARWDALTEFLK